MNARALAWTLLGGGVFGFGLALSTMTMQEVVLSFLQLEDFGLLLVMGGGIVVTGVGFRVARLLRPTALSGHAFENVRDVFDARTVLGAVIFGLGWGVSGLCPGSALASLGTGNWPVLVGLAGMLLGAWAQSALLPDPDRGGSPPRE